MQLIVSDTYEGMSTQLADDLIAAMQQREHPLLCVASGDSPKALYKELVDRVQRNELDMSSWYFVGLDEWLGMNGQDEGSCRFYLDQQLFTPLQTPASRLCFFNGKAADPVAECNRVESFIRDHGGIQVAIVGLGMNGHVGLNEPGTSSSARAHVSVLDPVTQRVGQKYFKQETALTGGITLGIANLLEANHLFLLANGSRKATILQRVLEQPITEEMPASLLRHHSHFHMYLDREAASLLQKRANAD